MKTINNFPQKIQDSIRETLTAFQGVYVIRENGQYHTSSGIALTTSNNADDYKSWHFRNTDIYTEEEIAEHCKALPEMNW